MPADFFERPILNSPYEYPAQHWDLDEDGLPTNEILETRRHSDLITPVPKPRARRRGRGQIILLEREKIKRRTIEHRRLQHRKSAA